MLPAPGSSRVSDARPAQEQRCLQGLGEDLVLEEGRGTLGSFLPISSLFWPVDLPGTGPSCHMSL